MNSKKAILMSLTGPQDIEKLTNLYDMMPCSIYIYDLTSQTFIFCNNQLLSLCGYTKDEVQIDKQHIFSQLIHKDDVKHLTSLQNDILSFAGDHNFQANYRLIAKNGRSIWVQDRCAVLQRDGNGQAQLLVGIIEDISRFIDDHAFRRVLLQTQEVSPNLYMFVDERFQIEFVTGQLKSISGLAPGVALNSIFDESTCQMFAFRMEKCRNSNSPWHGAGTLRLKDSLAEIPIILTATLVKDHLVSNPLFCVQIMDITDIKKTENELDEARLRTKIALEANSMGVFEYSYRSHKFFWDEHSKKILGIPEAVTETTMPELARILAVNESYEKIRNVFEKEILTEYPANIEIAFAIKRIPDQILQLKVYGTVIFDELGGVERVVGIMMDITQSESIRMALSDSQENIVKIIDAVPDPIFVKDEQHRWTYGNEAFCKILGMNRAQWIGKSDYDLFPKDMADVFWRKDEEVFKSMQTIQNEEFITGPDGQTRVISTKKTPYVNRDGKLSLVGVIRDITETKMLEREVRDSELLMRTFVEELPLPVAMIDKHFNFITCSKAWLKEFNLLPSAALGKSIFELLPLPMTQIRQHIIRCMQNETFRSSDEKIATPLGVHSYRVYIHPWVKDEEQQGLTVLLENLTEQKQKEEQLKVAELKHINAARLISMGEMAAGIAHEINNPLAVIKGKAQLLRLRIENKEKLTPAYIVDACEKIAEFSDRIHKITKGLQNVSRDAAKDPKQPVAINDICQDALNLCSERFKNHGIELKYIAPKSELMVFGRAVQIAQIMTNLLGNAFDSVRETKAQKWVHLQVIRHGDFARITVSDGGAGIPKNLADKVFEPFFTTKEIGKGTGLGLSLCLAFVREHGGQIFFEHRASGFAMIVDLPLAESMQKSA